MEIEVYIFEQEGLKPEYITNSIPAQLKRQYGLTDHQTGRERKSGRR